MWILYILKCADNTLYTWITTNLERRLKEHNNSPKWAKYTRIRRPVEVVFSMSFDSRSEATKEELNIKKMTKIEKERLITWYSSYV
jgi:putative endonuclease